MPRVPLMMRWVWLAASLAMTGCSAGASTQAGDAGTPPRDAAPASDAQPGRDASTAADTGVQPDAAGPDDAGLADAEPSVDAGPSDPFAIQPDESEGLTNVSTDLEALLEQGMLPNACPDYEANPTDRRKMLLCGKYMFFYEHFGTSGVPALLIDFMTQNFEDEVGPGFEKMGMVADPYSTHQRPLGLAPGAPANGVDSLVWTCAACHFGKLPDGRYAVGAPNTEYDYSKQVLAVGLVPASVAPSFDPAAHAPQAIQKVQPMIDVLAADRALRIRLLLNLLPLIGGEQPVLGIEREAQYASWPPGTMDFLIAPLPLDDEVHTVSKIIDLWGIPRPEEETRAGMPHGLLAWTGGAPGLNRFLTSFVRIGGGPEDEWTEERLRPAVEYIYSLRAPQNPTPPPATEVATGRMLFDRDCLQCHGAPRGSGNRLFSFEEMGTDEAMKSWADPDLDGSLCCGLGDGMSNEATHALKSPRLVGTWAKRRFLHNGAVEGLEALFCLQGARPNSTAHGLGAEGHADLCDDYDPDEKRALIALLRSL